MVSVCRMIHIQGGGREAFSHKVPPRAEEAEDVHALVEGARKR